MKDPYYVMGMKCIKCRVVIGSLLIPDWTPEEFGEFLTNKKIYPICNSCHEKNPRNLSAETLEEFQ